MRVVSVLALLLISSAATEIIGIHALFGAFLLGAILPKGGGLSPLFTSKLESTVVLLFLPCFFAYSGLRTQTGLVSGTHELLPTFGTIAVATLSKFGGAALAARVTVLNWREASAVGVLMNTRGLMELIVLNIAVDLGVITPTVFTMLVLMALATTVATTPLVRWILTPIAAAEATRPGRVCPE